VSRKVGLNTPICMYLTTQSQRVLANRSGNTWPTRDNYDISYFIANRQAA